jgi:BMFP domain-containing protein YqiC
MTQSPELETRVSALEHRVEQVAGDATAARHLAAAVDRDLSELTVKVDGLRRAVHGLGVQTNERFTRLEERVERLEARVDVGFAEVARGFAQVDAGFAGVRGRLDGFAAGQQQVVTMLTTLIERDERSDGSAGP